MDNINPQFIPFVLGVGCTFFSTIVLSKNLPFSPGFRSFSRKKDPWKEWGRTPETIRPSRSSFTLFVGYVRSPTLNSNSLWHGKRTVRGFGTLLRQSPPGLNYQTFLKTQGDSFLDYSCQIRSMIHKPGKARYTPKSL